MYARASALPEGSVLASVQMPEVRGDEEQVRSIGKEEGNANG
jgi:hypothetical protein